MSEQQQAQFEIQRIYIKDSSFESPRSPAGFRGDWQPNVNLELNSRHALIEDNLYEVVLHLTVTAKNKDEQVMYLVEVHQAGIFMLRGLEEDRRLQTLGGYCPDLLFPYARDAIDHMVVKGSFPPLMLRPVNLQAMYEQSLLERARQEDKIQ